MDSYTLSRLFHKMIRKSWTEDKEIKVNASEWMLDDFFSTLFRLVPHKIILLATDGHLTTVNLLSDPTPPSFLKKRFMKIDNRNLHTNPKTTIKVLYQLLSIDMEDTSLLDLMGLVKFLISFCTENAYDMSACLIFKWIRTCVFHGPSFVDAVTWKKNIRDPILSHHYDSIEQIDTVHESMLKRIESYHTILQTVSNTVSLFEERMDLYKDRMDHFQEKIEFFVRCLNEPIKLDDPDH